jgi:outer membrane autotransporter protein
MPAAATTLICLYEIWDDAVTVSLSHARLLLSGVAVLWLAQPAAAVDYVVGDATQLAGAILSAGNGDRILLSADIAISGPLPTLTRNNTIDAGGQTRIFFAETGTIRIEDVTLANGLAEGGTGGGPQSGGGGGGGGGGLGAGGALFVNSGANVTLANVALSNNSAAGGAGGTANGGGTFDAGGGGGGLGGNGGQGGYEGGGGGGGFEGNGGSGQQGPGDNAGSGGGGKTADGGNAAGNTPGGGGGTEGGGGAAFGGSGTAGDAFGGGGGGGTSGGGGAGGDFGGGGGAGYLSTVGGAGGFGGGGGGAGGAIIGGGGAGGFGGGDGGANQGGGGGGDALGGAIFVRSGGTLTIVDGTSSAGTVTAGAGGTGMSGGIAGSVEATAFYVMSQAILRADSDTTVAGTIGGGGGIEKTGAAVLTLSGTNTYTGDTIVSEGTLSIATDDNLGDAAGSLVLDGGGLRTTADLTTARYIVLDPAGGTFAPVAGTTLQLDDDIGGAGGLTLDGPGTLVLTGANSYAGGTTIGGDGTLSISADVNLGAASGGLVFDGGALETTADITTARDITLLAGGGAFLPDLNTTLTLTGDIGGAGELIAAGDGTLILAGDNSHTGGTSNFGELQLGTTTLRTSLVGTISNAGYIDVVNADLGGVTTILNGGLLAFSGTSSAADTDITSLVGLQFLDQGTAGNARILIDGSLGLFIDQSTGGSAVITAENGAQVVFADEADPEGAALVANDSLFDISFTLGADGIVSAGSIAGNAGGAFFLGENLFVVGGSGASTTFDGEIADGCICGVVGGSLAKVGAGILTLGGDSTYTGVTMLLQGGLVVDGSLLSGVRVEGGRLGGSGTIGGLSAVGGVVAPGNSIGTLDVAGDVSFDSGSVYEVEIDAAGGSDLIRATGAAMLDGGSVVVMAEAGAYTSQTYRILAAASVAGSFDEVESNLAFLEPTLTYTGTGVFLNLAVTDEENPFGSAADTANRRAVAGALDAAGPAGPLYGALIGQTLPGARAAFDALSGEAYASAEGVLLSASDTVRDALLRRMRQAPYAGASGDTLTALAFGGPELAYDVANGAPAATVDGIFAAAERPAAVWSEAFGEWSTLDGDGNAARVEQSLGGFMAGADMAYDDVWRFGLAAGYTDQSFTIGDGRGSDGDVRSGHLAAYATGTFGQLVLRGGTAFSLGEADIHRDIAFPGFAAEADSDFSVWSGQAFAELGYGFAFGGLAVEPFAGLAYSHVGTGSFEEDGGAAALEGGSSGHDSVSTSLGVRVATQLALGEAIWLKPHAGVAWRHAFGDLTPERTLAFASGGADFDVAGPALARDSLAVEAGFDLSIGENATFGIGYDGVFSGETEEHAATASFSLRF